MLVHRDAPGVARVLRRGAGGLLPRRRVVEEALRAVPLVARLEERRALLALRTRDDGRDFAHYRFILHSLFEREAQDLGLHLHHHFLLFIDGLLIIPHAIFLSIYPQSAYEGLQANDYSQLQRLP